VPQPDCDIAVEDRAMRFSPSTDSALSDRSLRQRILEIAKLEAWQMNGPEEGSFPEPLSSEEVADLEDLLASMLKYDARERMTLDQISAHPWFSKDYATDVKGDWLQRWS
jgi:serine/threonine protein kinase